MSAQKYNTAFSIGSSIFAFRRFRKSVLIYLCEIGLLNLYLNNFKINNIMCKQIAMRCLFCNKVNTVQLITVSAGEEVTGTRKNE